MVFEMVHEHKNIPENALSWSCDDAIRTYLYLQNLGDSFFITLLIQYKRLHQSDMTNWKVNIISVWIVCNLKMHVIYFVKLFHFDLSSCSVRRKISCFSDEIVSTYIIILYFLNELRLKLNCIWFWKLLNQWNHRQIKDFFIVYNWNNYFTWTQCVKRAWSWTKNPDKH